MSCKTQEFKYTCEIQTYAFINGLQLGRDHKPNKHNTRPLSEHRGNKRLFLTARSWAATPLPGEDEGSWCVVTASTSVQTGDQIQCSLHPRLPGSPSATCTLPWLTLLGCVGFRGAAGKAWRGRYQGTKESEAEAPAALPRYRAISVPEQSPRLL